MDIKHLATTKNPSLEISMNNLGHPGIRGELHILAQSKDEALSSDGSRLSDKSERKFIVSGLLSKQAYGPNINGKIAGDFSKEDGASYLVSTHAALKVQTPASDVAYYQLTVEKNALGECSMVTLECVATEISVARNIFFGAVAPFLDHVAYSLNVPVYVSTVRIEDVKNRGITIDYISPYQGKVIDQMLNELFSEMKPIYALYREAKNSNSDFYKFLCFYKILEGLLGAMRADVRKKARDNRIELAMAEEIVPQHEAIPDVLKIYVGKGIKYFIDTVLTPEFRNAVAHFQDEEKAIILQASDPVHMGQYANLILICELCVRRIIASHESMLHQIFDPLRQKALENI